MRSTTCLIDAVGACREEDGGGGGERGMGPLTRVEFVGVAMGRTVQ